MMDFVPPIDLTLFPATLDLLHLTLAGLSLLLLIVTLIMFVVLLSHTRKAKRAPAAKTAKSKPLAATVESAPPMPAVKPVVIHESGPEAALQLLGLLQSEARFIDFIEENIAVYGDADIGAAVRVVHAGCRKVLQDHFQLKPVRSEAEGERVSLPKGFDASAIRLTGNITGTAPFHGTLVHRGWRADKVSLPQIAAGHDLHIIAPAEVEL